MTDFAGVSIFKERMTTGPISRWAIRGSATNFNDTVVQLRQSQVAELLSSIGDKFITSVRLGWVPETSGAGIGLYVIANLGRGSDTIIHSQFLGVVTSLATHTPFTWEGLLPVRWAEIAETTAAFAAYLPAGPHNNDDMTIGVEGFTRWQTPDGATVAQATRLDGIKWPLEVTRR